MVLYWKVLVNCVWCEKLVWLCVLVVSLDDFVRSLIVLLVGESPLVVMGDRDKFFYCIWEFPLGWLPL